MLSLALRRARASMICRPMPFISSHHDLVPTHLLLEQAPLFVGSPCTARAEVTEFHKTKPVITMKIQCLDDKGQVLMEGSAKAMIRQELYDASIEK